MNDFLAVLSAAIWLYLLVGRGGFWRAAVRDLAFLPVPNRWPGIVAVIPARNEADCIGESLQSVLNQAYPGELTVVVVDDDSVDGTAEIARQTAARYPARGLTVVGTQGTPPNGWTGKLWALRQGIAAAEAEHPDYILLTDADIVHAPDTLRWLAAQAEVHGLTLTSLMARLRCESFAERSHVPAFVYFFQMLFPFAWVNEPQARTAAAAGGCMLVRTEMLRQIGGITAIRNAWIDDCALAVKLKPLGPIWLGLTERVRSIRRYDKFTDVAQMVARSAYAQLNCSVMLLAGCLAGMLITFMVPPVLALYGTGPARWLGLATWLAMAASFVPMLRLYRLSLLWSLTLPVIALLYMLYTLSSAYRHMRRRGAEWKGRFHVDIAGAS
jgi:hopene-associated glycosyltransferase HpnB